MLFKTLGRFALGVVLFTVFVIIEIAALALSNLGFPSSLPFLIVYLTVMPAIVFALLRKKSKAFLCGGAIGTFCTIGLFIFSMTLSPFGNAQKDAKWTFKTFLKNPIPASVKIVEGEAWAWLDPYAYVTFKTDDKTFAMLSQGYEPIPATHSIAPCCRDKAIKNEKIISLVKIEGECTKEERYPEGTYYGDFLFWDTTNKIAYFCTGVGNKLGKALKNSGDTLLNYN